MTRNWRKQTHNINLKPRSNSRFLLKKNKHLVCFLYYYEKINVNFFYETLRRVTPSSSRSASKQLSSRFYFHLRIRKLLVMPVSYFLIVCIDFNYSNKYIASLYILSIISLRVYFKWCKTLTLLIFHGEWDEKKLWDFLGTVNNCIAKWRRKVNEFVKGYAVVSYIDLTLWKWLFFWNENKSKCFMGKKWWFLSSQSAARLIYQLN